VIVNVAGVRSTSAEVISLSRRKSVRDPAELAYRRVVEQARQPVFFAAIGVPDTLDGRFELICLHAFLYLHRLKSDRPRSGAVSQAFFDAMFADMDQGLREMGTGDLSVGRHVKRMAQGFYGRIRAYQAGLEQDDSALRAALARNVFGTVGESVDAVDRMVDYVRSAVLELTRQSSTELLEGGVQFPLPQGARSSAAPAELVRRE
jgi:cytochrome b pre-mRNA-processing protein 3